MERLIFSSTMKKAAVQNEPHQIEIKPFPSKNQA
jgi:hypothetical protein